MNTMERFKPDPDIPQSSPITFSFAPGPTVAQWGDPPVRESTTSIFPKSWSFIQKRRFDPCATPAMQLRRSRILIFNTAPPNCLESCSPLPALDKMILKGMYEDTGHTGFFPKW